MRLRAVAIVTTMLYLVTISTLSLVSISKDLPDMNIPYIDKIVHFCFYLGLNFLLLTTLYVLGKDRWQSVMGATLVAALYGVVIELVQPLVGRSGDMWDAVANSVGAICGALLFKLRCVESVIKILGKLNMK